MVSREIEVIQFIQIRLILEAKFGGDPNIQFSNGHFGIKELQTVKKVLPRLRQKANQRFH